MFESLSDKLKRTLKNLRGEGVLTKEHIDAALREIRLALLEADVNYKVAKDFIVSVKEKAEGQQVWQELKPSEQVVKIVYDELVDLLGGQSSRLVFTRAVPNVVMIVGLQGSGKTTTTGKLAKWLAGHGHRPIVVSTDVYRPAAREQLAQVAKAISVPCWPGAGSNKPLEIAKGAIRESRLSAYDVILVDTAGRLHIDDDLMKELSELKRELQPAEILFIADSMIGQDAVRSAQEFHERLGTSGVILTKLDGDARGGAALSIHHVTGQPIKFIGVGEKYDALEVFYPDRIVSRILGMGDMLSLIEKAEQTIDKQKALEVQRKIVTDTFTLEDFRDQLRQMRKLGPVDQMMGMLPKVGIFKDAAKAHVDEKELVHIEAIIDSMTRRERNNHELINGKRRKRIARGSGTTVQLVNQVLKQFVQTKKMMKTLGRGLFGRQLAGLKMPVGSGGVA